MGRYIYYNTLTYPLFTANLISGLKLYLTQNIKQKNKNKNDSSFVVLKNIYWVPTYILRIEQEYFIL